MNKTTGNELIAEFDGRKFKPYKGNSSYTIEFDSYAACQKWIKENKADGYSPEIGYQLGTGQYHTSWDWLMPVVEKISKERLEHWDGTKCTDIIDTCYPITFNMPTENGKVMFRFKGFSLHEADTLIEAVWQAVIEFITWHTKQN